MIRLGTVVAIRAMRSNRVTTPTRTAHPVRFIGSNLVGDLCFAVAPLALLAAALGSPLADALVVATALVLAAPSAIAMARRVRLLEFDGVAEHA